MEQPTLPSATQPPQQISLFRVIYNIGCSENSFDDEFFSNLFIKTYKEKFNDNEIEYYFSKRYNPKVLEIYDLLGNKSNCCYEIEDCYSSLKITYFPEELKDYMKIVTFEDKEMLGIDESKLYEEFFKKVIKGNECIVTLKAHYQRLEYVMEIYCKHFKNGKPNHDIFIYP